jgi:glycosyltransferase involved in cell wall biosynthesis
MEKMERKKIKVAMLLPDDRFGKNLPMPFFGSAPTALLQGFEMLGNDVIEVHIISCVIRELPAPKKLADNIWYHQIVLPKWTFLRALHLGPILAVRRKLREIQPDLVHSQGTEMWCAITGCLSGYPSLLTIHGNLRLINKVTPMRPFFYWKLQEYLEAISVRLFNGIICITNYTLSNVKNINKNTWLLPNAVDRNFLNFGKEKEKTLNIAESIKKDSKTKQSKSYQTTILVVGVIQPRKNQNSFIKSLDAIAEPENIKVKFIGACGSDKYADEFLNNVSKRSWCEYAGTKNRSELLLEFENADMLVLPTLEDNCPMVVLEAQASMLPVIASDVGGVPDLITHGITGILVNPELPSSFSASVIELKQNPVFKSKIIENALKSASSRFSPNHIANQHMLIYSKIIKKHKA